jgi:two-component system NtrC family sensor kinase
VDADGFERWVQTIKTPIRDEHGRVIGTAGIAREITDRKLAENAMRRANDQLEAKIEERTQALTELNNQLEKQLAERQSLEAQLVHVQKMESLGELAAGVAHEINNPVAFITSNLGTMTEYIGTLKRLLECYEVMAAKVSATVEPSPELQALFQEIAEISLAEDLPFIKRDIDNLLMESLDGTDRVKEIVQGLKSFARGDTDEIHEADLNECLETSLKIVWNELKYKCRVEKRLGRLPRIPCHPGQLNQVFMNLLVNAAQAIAEHGDIFLETLLEEGEWIVINIRDNGHGISKEHLSTIFDPFFTTKPVGKGTGLGLSISYGIIRKHNGIIQVESTPGQGSTFTIRLPIKGIYHDKKDHSLR